MQNNYRFYSFVAGLYLSPIQCGIQTAHAVSEMSVTTPVHLMPIYNAWAEQDKVLIVCQAVNHAGVMSAYEQLQMFGEALSLPVTVFFEDEQSMNSMATAAGIIVPEIYHSAKAVRIPNIDEIIAYQFTSDEDPSQNYTFHKGDKAFAFIEFLKSYRLA